jgi:hypothetical protein
LLPVNTWFDPNPFFEAHMIRSHTNVRRDFVRNQAMVNSEPKAGEIFVPAFVPLEKSCCVTQPTTNQSGRVKTWLLYFGVRMHHVSNLGRTIESPRSNISITIILTIITSMSIKIVVFS